MVLASFALVTALFVALSGNSARLANVLADRTGIRRSLVLPALLGQLAIIGLLLLAGAALAAPLGEEFARAGAAGILALAAFLVLRPYPLVEPSEPTRSAVALGLVTAAFAVRDGLAALALALGLVASDFMGLAAGLGMGAGVATTLAVRGGAARFGVNARYLAAILLASGAVYFGVFAQ